MTGCETRPAKQHPARLASDRSHVAVSIQLVRYPTTPGALAATTQPVLSCTRRQSRPLAAQYRPPSRHARRVLRALPPLLPPFPTLSCRRPRPHVSCSQLYILVPPARSPSACLWLSCLGRVGAALTFALHHAVFLPNHVSGPDPPPRPKPLAPRGMGYTQPSSPLPLPLPLTTTALCPAR